MATFFYAIAFVFGLAAGSFLNVLTLRYRPERNFFSREAWGGRSHCMTCGVTLRWYELVPLLSFFVQGGKCRSCGARLLRQYPVVELAAGLLAVGIPLFFGSWYGVAGAASFSAPLWYYGYLILWYAIALAWLAVVVVDIKHYLIPDELNVALAVLGVAMVALFATHAEAFPAFRYSFLKHFALIFSPEFLGSVWVEHLAGAVAGGLFFWLLTLVKHGEAMGFGDVKFVLVSGFILGWPDIVFAAMLAFIVGGVWGATLMFVRRKRIGDKLPFAPFLVAGFFGTIALGFPLLSWYFRLLNF